MALADDYVYGNSINWKIGFPAICAQRQRVKVCDEMKWDRDLTPQVPRKLQLPVADPEGGAPGARPPPPFSVQFIDFYMLNFWFLSPYRKFPIWAPPPVHKILDPPLGATDWPLHYMCIQAQIITSPVTNTQVSFIFIIISFITRPFLTQTSFVMILVLRADRND